MNDTHVVVGGLQRADCGGGEDPTRDSLDTFSTMDTVLGTLAMYLGIIPDNILAKEKHNNHYLLVMSCVDPKTVWF